jgi:hypothetical protein
VAAAAVVLEMMKVVEVEEMSLGSRAGRAKQCLVSMRVGICSVGYLAVVCDAVISDKEYTMVSVRHYIEKNSQGESCLPIDLWCNTYGVIRWRRPASSPIRSPPFTRPFHFHSQPCSPPPHRTLLGPLALKSSSISERQPRHFVLVILCTRSISIRPSDFFVAQSRISTPRN